MNPRTLTVLRSFTVPPPASTSDLYNFPSSAMSLSTSPFSGAPVLTFGALSCLQADANNGCIGYVVTEDVGMDLSSTPTVLWQVGLPSGDPTNGQFPIVEYNQSRYTVFSASVSGVFFVGP